ncbi:MAG: hypothetical protein P4L83_15785 [Nevskia sp.]|nr:hypothetical protein [Nevskia sp.]
MRKPDALDLLLPPLAFLAALPLGWLAGAWSEDASRSLPLWLATMAGGGLLWRMVGEQLPGSSAHYRYALTLLICGAALRTVERVAPLCGNGGRRLETYSLAVLGGTSCAAAPVPPSRRALLGALWVPAELLLGRVLSAGLQPAAGL